MEWGFLTTTHIITLIMAVLIIIGLYFLLKNKSDKTQFIIMFSLSFLGIAGILWGFYSRDSIWEALPLQLCSLNAMMLPIAVYTKNKVINNLLLVWSLGALIALVLNNEVVHYELLSLRFFFYYFPHVIEFGLPILMLTLKRAKLDVKCILSTVAITMGAYTVIHFINLWINSSVAGVHVNYMFSLQPNNPVLELFISILPYQYWYMFLCIPVLVVYLSCIYCVQIKNIIVNTFKKTNQTKKSEELTEVKE